MEVLSGFWDFLRDSYVNSPQDPRTQNWLFVKHEWLVYAIIGVWFYFVLSWGPKYMKNRKPYDLKTFIFYYNIFQILYNGWIVYAGITNGLFTDFGLGCVMVDRSLTGKPMALANVFFWTLLLKIIDLVETVIFVLRKKDRQISFLHLYHHVSTIYLVLVSVKIYPGGMASVSMIINSSVHVIMYTYYLLSSQGPFFQQLVAPIKPWITIIQMVQFFFLLGHTTQGFFPSCTVPRWGALTLFINLILNWILFYNFYRKTYKEKPKSN